MAKKADSGESAAAVAEPEASDLVVAVPEAVEQPAQKGEFVYFAIGEPNLQIQYAIQQKDSGGKVSSEPHNFASTGAPFVAIDVATARGKAQADVLRMKQRKGGRVREIKAAPPVKMLEAFSDELAERIKDADGEDDNKRAKSATRIARAVFERWIKKFGWT